MAVKLQYCLKCNQQSQIAEDSQTVLYVWEINLKACMLWDYWHRLSSQTWDLIQIHAQASNSN